MKKKGSRGFSFHPHKGSFFLKGEKNVFSPKVFHTGRGGLRRKPPNQTASNSFKIIGCLANGKENSSQRGEKDISLNREKIPFSRNTVQREKRGIDSFTLNQGELPLLGTWGEIADALGGKKKGRRRGKRGEKTGFRQQKGELKKSRYFQKKERGLAIGRKKGGILRKEKSPKGTFLMLKRVGGGKYLCLNEKKAPGKKEILLRGRKTSIIKQ